MKNFWRCGLGLSGCVLGAEGFFDCGVGSVFSDLACVTMLFGVRFECGLLVLFSLKDTDGDSRRSSFCVLLCLFLVWLV